MSTHSILVVDGTRARLLSLEHTTDQRRPTRLAERLDLINPEHQQHEHEKFTSDRSESRGNASGHAYNLDDNRAGQDREHEKRFARLVLTEARRVTQELGATHLLIVAPPRMLGVLRAEGYADLQRGLEVTDHGSEISKLSVTELQSHLEAARLIPLEIPSSGGAHPHSHR